MSFTCSDWTSVTDEALKGLEANRGEYDFIVCQGLSGQAIAFVAAHKLNVPLLILRKPANVEDSKRARLATASGLAGRTRYKAGDKPEPVDWSVPILEGAQQLVEWVEDGKKPRVCFVDDCISGGKTRLRCGAAVHHFGGELTCECATVFQKYEGSYMQEYFALEAKTMKVALGY